MKNMMNKMRKGATFIEYALLAGLVAIVVAVAVLAFGDKLKGTFSETGNKVDQVQEGVKAADLKPNVTPQE